VTPRTDGVNLLTAQWQGRLAAECVCTHHCWSWHTGEFSAVQDEQASLGWKLPVPCWWSWNASCYNWGLCM